MRGSVDSPGKGFRDERCYEECREQFGTPPKGIEAKG